MSREKKFDAVGFALGTIIVLAVVAILLTLAFKHDDRPNQRRWFILDCSEHRPYAECREDALKLWP